MTSARRYELPPGHRGEPVLTVRQPWASAIFIAGKDVENRTWATKYSGRLWIHAAQTTTRRAPDEWAAKNKVWVPEEPLLRGVILGCVELTEIVQDSKSVWALDDHFHWLLRKPCLLTKPVPWQGRLGLTFIRPPQGDLTPARRSRKSS